MKFIKIFKSVLFGASVLFAAAACTDLEVSERDSLVVESKEGFVAGNPTELLASSYKDLGTIPEQDGIYSLYEHTSDEMIPPTRGTDWGDNGVWRSLHQHTWDATHRYVLSSWNLLNSRAFKCNQILASSPSAQQAAEAKFLRAFYRFHVMDLFGQMPNREVNEGVKVSPKVYTRSEAYDLIIKDLTDALPDLPATGPKAKNSAATQSAANALLARLYLNKAVYKSARPEGPYTFDAGDMDKVIEYCDKVTAAGYSLEADYFTNFSTNATSEVIFTSAEGSPQNRYHMTLHYDQKPGGWNGFTTLAEFYDKFENTDQRKGKASTPDGSELSGLGRGFLVGTQLNGDGSIITNGRTKKPLNYTKEIPLSGADTDQGIRVIKYHPSDKGQYILLRYADVFLMKAEALLRKGNAGAALTEVNALRAKRGASQLASIDAAGLLDERGRELYWEGIRRIDQIRFGTWSKTWSFKTVTDGSRVLFPIPQQALDSNPNLSQNAGY